ncbi:hypothetical protein FRB94_008631 [Tulasnella sp. JGI-2019a]|nr:hypothetical protein FRB94_008631 [Tulasnella sp. JGI-2019a]
MSSTKSVPGISSPAALEDLKFRGGPNEDVSDFLGAIRRAPVQQDRHMDNEWMVAYTESCLRGDAMEWFDELGPAVATMDWIPLRKAFLHRFRTTPSPPAAAAAAATKTVGDAATKAAKRATAAVATATKTAEAATEQPRPPQPPQQK